MARADRCRHCITLPLAPLASPLAQGVLGHSAVEVYLETPQSLCLLQTPRQPPAARHLLSQPPRSVSTSTAKPFPLQPQITAVCTSTSHDQQRAWTVGETHANLLSVNGRNVYFLHFLWLFPVCYSKIFFFLYSSSRVNTNVTFF